MKLLVVVALCAFGLIQARRGSVLPSGLSWSDQIVPEYDIQEEAFRSGKEYRFIYNGQLLTGIPSSSRQHSGSRFQALVSLVFQTQDTVLMQITHMRMGKLNRPLPNPREILPFAVFKDAPISQELLERLQAPVKFTFRQGVISDIVFDGIEQPWSANIKRGIFNLLQVNLGRQGQIQNSETLNLNEFSSNTFSPQMDFFRVMEPTLEGECETAYTVVQEPNRFVARQQPVLNVTKSINFENCLRRPEMKYNWRFQSFCPTCEQKFSQQDKFLKSSSIFQFNITGTQDSFLIERARAESQYVVVPFNEEGNVIVTYVNQTLVLVQAGPVQTRIPDLQQPVESDTDMIYSQDWDTLREKFFLQGDEEFLEQTNFANVDKVQFVSTILRRLLNQMRESVQDEAPEQFSQLVKVFRFLNAAEIERVWKNFYINTPTDFTPEEHKKVKSFIIDAVAFAGTKDCVFFLVQKIKSRQIQPFLASLAIKSFINIQVVSQEMIDELFTLAESEVCRRNFFLKQSVFLTIGSLMNALCRPSADRLALEQTLQNPESFFCPRELKQRYVEDLFNRFRSAKQFEDKILFLRTISNAGLDLSVFELEKIIKNVQPYQDYSFYFKAEAILALRQLQDIMPRKIQRILMPVFMNRNLTPELRIVATYQIFKTLPERAILDQIANRLFSEPSRQVLSFVFTYMNTISNSSIPCERKFAQDMKLAMRHSRFVEFAFNMGYSKAIHRSFYNERYNLGLGVSVFNFFSNTSYIPIGNEVEINPVFGGFWAKQFFTFGVTGMGFENMFWKYFGERGFFFEKPLEELLRRSPRSVNKSPMEQLNSMFQSLRIRPRQHHNKQPFALSYLRFKNQEFGFLPFSFESLPEELLKMFESGSFNVQRIEQFLESGYQFEFFKGVMLHEMRYKIPTSIGFPLTFKVTVPTVMSLTGQIRAEFQGEKSFRQMSISFKDLKPSFVSTWYNTVSVFNPVVNSGLYVLGKAKFFYPFTGSMLLNLQKQPREFLFNFEPATRPVDVFTLETRPVTFTRDFPINLQTIGDQADQITVAGEDWTRVNQFDRSFGKHLFGVEMNIRGFWHKTPAMRQSDTPFCPLSGPNKLVFRTQPGYEMPKEFIFKLTGDFFQPITETLKPQLDSFQSLFEDSVEPFNLDTLRNIQPRNPTKHQIQLEIITRSSSNPRRFAFDSLIKCGSYLRFCRFSTRFERSAIPRVTEQPFKLAFEGETIFPVAPFTFSELVGKKAVAWFKLNWGPSFESNNFVRFNVIGERSQQQIQFERSSPEYQYYNELSMEQDDDFYLNSPVSQYRHIYRFAQLLQYRLNLEYNQVPEVFQNYANYVFRYFKNQYFWQTNVNQFNVQNPENRIQAFLNIDPVNKNYFNFTFRTPQENVQFQDVPIRFPLSVSPVNVRHSTPVLSFLDSIRGYTPFSRQPVCQVNSRFIETFDNVRYTVPLSNCWSAMVKDCRSENPQFGVYMKKLSQESPLKKIRIITPLHQFYLVPENRNYDSVMIEFNGQKFSPEQFQPVREHGHIIAQAEKVGQYMMFQLPEAGIKVFFDGYSANIKMSQFYRSIQCGLCGNFNYESDDEFRLPSNQLTEDVREFFQSYTIQEDSCTLPEINQICSSPRCESTSFTAPVVFPVCQLIVNEALQLNEEDDDELTQTVLRSIMERLIQRYPASQRPRLTRFFESKIQELLQQIQQSAESAESASQICQQIDTSSISGSLTRPLAQHLTGQQLSSHKQSHFQHQQQWQLRNRHSQHSIKRFHSLTHPVLTTKVIEQSHQLCFSVQPVPVCAHHTFAHSFRPAKRVVYTCLSRDDRQAETLFRQVSNRFAVLSEVSGLPASFTQSERIPERCQHL